MESIKTPLGRVTMIPKGVYSSTETYNRLDLVTYTENNVLGVYIAKKDNLKNVPPSISTSWMKLIDANDTMGPTGPTGPAGTSVGFDEPSANINILPSSSNPTVSISASGPDTNKKFEFSFGIPSFKNNIENPISLSLKGDEFRLGLFEAGNDANFELGTAYTNNQVGITIAQYTENFNIKERTLTLLNSQGNTIIPGELSLGSPLAIAYGGTGANNANQAWTNLGGGSIGKKDYLEASDIPNIDANKITTGVLPIERGGTSSTTRLLAAKAFTNENVNTDANYFVTFTNNWGKFGYSTTTEAWAALGGGDSGKHPDDYYIKSSDSIIPNFDYADSVTSISTESSVGTSTKVSRGDHVHNISLTTGDENGQVKIAGVNIDVKGLQSAAYTATTNYFPSTGGNVPRISIGNGDNIDKISITSVDPGIGSPLTNNYILFVYTGGGGYYSGDCPNNVCFIDSCPNDSCYNTPCYGSCYSDSCATNNCYTECYNSNCYGDCYTEGTNTTVRIKGNDTYIIDGDGRLVRYASADDTYNVTDGKVIERQGYYWDGVYYPPSYGYYYQIGENEYVFVKTVDTTYTCPNNCYNTSCPSDNCYNNPCYGDCYTNEPCQVNECYDTACPTDNCYVGSPCPSNSCNYNGCSSYIDCYSGDCYSESNCPSQSFYCSSFNDCLEYD